MSYLVKDMRAWVRNDVPKEFLSPGWYTWWADEKTCRKLLGDHFKHLWPLMTEGSDDCKDKKLVYVGITTKGDLWKRVGKWHILEKHTHSKVRRKTLSTLRQSLCSLLGDDWMDATTCNQVQDLMRVEIHPIQLPFRDSRLNEKTDHIERQMMNDHVLPLNIQKNNNPTVRVFKIYLKARRKATRLATLDRLGVNP